VSPTPPQTRDPRPTRAAADTAAGPRTDPGRATPARRIGARRSDALPVNGDRGQPTRARPRGAGSVPAGTRAALAYATRHRGRFLAEVAEFAAIPSVSADPARRADVRRAARWLAGRLRAAGLRDVRVLRTAGHPVVLAGWGDDPGRPTLLVYGHYDVQPAGPAGAWPNPPFRPTVHNGLMVGRGVSDDKGQLLAHVAALESWLRGAGGLPVNVRCVFDGEEEVGSPHLGAVLDRCWPWLRADGAVISDTRMRSARRPALTVSLRGTLRVEIVVRGPARDLHSGTFGGAVAEPARELCRLLAGLHDEQGRPAPALRVGLRELPTVGAGPGDAELLALAGAAPPGTGTVEPGYSAYQRTTARPALTVAALRAGHRHGVLPNTARAAVDVRLAPGQRPIRVATALLRHLRAEARPGVTVSARVRAAAAPVDLPRAGPLWRAGVTACRRGFGRTPVPLRSGGTIPVVHQFAGRDVPVLLLGFALPDDRMHAPGERLSLTAFARSVSTCVHLLPEFARQA
jgi:acetylornithine deacetylase/succinyl-diaminopimelate desuccinylase-like protein